MAQVFLDDSKLYSWADALREATETTEPLVFPEGFNAAVRTLTKGVELPELTSPASENHVLQGYEIIDENGEVKLGNIPSQEGKTVTPTTSEQVAITSGVYTTGEVKVAAMPTAVQATPSISVSSAGLITASATQTAGYVSAGTKNATQQLTTKGATTITPSKSEQTAVAAGIYTTGTIKVAPYTPNNTALTATDNGTYTPTGYDGFSSVIVAIPNGDEVSY